MPQSASGQGIPLTQDLIQFGIWTTAIVLSLVGAAVTFLVASSYYGLSPQERAKKDREHKELMEGVTSAEGISPPPGTNWIFLPFIALAIVIAGTSAITHTLHALPPDVTRTIVGSVMILIVGSILFLLKVKLSIIYAVIEITFAIVFAIYTMRFDMTNYIGELQELKIGSSIYLLIRGFDNLRKGLDEAKKKKKDQNASASGSTKVSNGPGAVAADQHVASQ